MRWLTAALTLALSVGALSGAGAGAASQPPVLRAKDLVATDEKSAAAMAVAGSYLAWEDEGDDTGPLGLKERNLRTNKTQLLARNGLPEYGLGSTTGQVVFAEPRGDQVALIAVPHGGGRRLVLTQNLAAPFDARGRRVAWADVAGTMLRVAVHDFSTKKSTVLARFRRCTTKGCHNIDRVVVDGNSVMFDLSGIAGAPSLVIDIAFDSKKKHVTVIPNDPQPDLARSSSGALYYALDRGWFHWQPPARPKLTRYRTVATWLLDSEGGRLLYVSGGNQCVQQLFVRSSRGRLYRVPIPRNIPKDTKAFGRVCMTVSGFAWSGRQLYLGWTLVPQVSLGSHREPGLAGVITHVVTPG